VTIRPGFEGGQLPIIKRLPEQRGFRNPFRVPYQVVNLQALDKFESGAAVTAESLKAAGLIKSLRRPIKVLGLGEIGKALHVRVHKVSGSAKEKIAAAGGTSEEINASAATTAASSS
jgi:large subunit ribosomal protein L15